MFPTLKTGAVMQYPAKRTLEFNTDTIRFLDGTEQRFRDNPSVLHQWTIQLDLLDESELAALDQFFISNQGRFGSFSFTDPWDGTVYPNCSMAQDASLSTEGRRCGARLQSPSARTGPEMIYFPQLVVGRNRPVSDHKATPARTVVNQSSAGLPSESWPTRGGHHGMASSFSRK